MVLTTLSLALLALSLAPLALSLAPLAMSLPLSLNLLPPALIFERPQPIESTSGASEISGGRANARAGP